MRYTLRIIKSQPDHLGDPLPMQEFPDRFATVKEAVEYAEAVILEHDAPVGAYTYDVLDSDGNPVDGLTDQQP